MADVTLDIANFREHYPKFAEEKVSDAEVEDAWYFACSMCGSTDKDSRLPYMPAAEPPVYDRKIALYLIMCHVLTIGMWGGGQAELDAREDEVKEIQNGLSPVDPKKVAGDEKAKAGE